MRRLLNHGNDPAQFIHANALHDMCPSFVPDVLATQLQRRRLPVTAEVRLLAAVFATALEDLRADHPDAHWKRNDARRWFQSNSTLPWSFRWACEVLALDPEAVRKEIAHDQSRT